MTHFEAMLRWHDDETERILGRQLRAEGHPADGAFITPGGLPDGRNCGFMLAHGLVSYLIPESRWHHSEALAGALRAALDFVQRSLHPSGCLDLTLCNFDSAPDTAFTVNQLIGAWWLLEKDASPRTDWLREPLRGLIETCTGGVARGGFHTPNHRWAIASCLKHAALIAGREDFSRRADVYLGEGLDIDGDGEFAERSAGNYNQVNDDQMLRLYLATGDRRYLEAARANLRMMLAYIDPDGSIFTCNSTRQDYGQRVYPESYYTLYLLAGYLLGDEALAACAELCWQLAEAHGRVPQGVEWLALYPELEAFGKKKAPPWERVSRYDRFFPASGIARLRRGDWSCTAMAGRANFLYFRHGANVLYMVIYANVCDVRNFLPKTLEKTEEGYRLSAAAESWYYLPFEGDGPATADWWAMDNANTRRRLIADRLETAVDVVPGEDGAEVRVRAAGLAGVPLRIELGLLPGCCLRGEGFAMEAAAGQAVTLLGGGLEITGPEGDVISVSPCFGEHDFREYKDGAYPQSDAHFTAYLTAFTPFDRTLRIGTKPLFPPVMR